MLQTDEENVNLSSLADAQAFLSQFDWYTSRLEMSIGNLQAPMYEGDNLGPERFRKEVVNHWSEIMSQLPLAQQQDRAFQNTLTAALENAILSQVHDRVFQELFAKYEEKDHKIRRHCQYLTEKNISADKLGVPEGYALSFPAAVVELAALDIQKCPLDKLRCLRSTLDYIEAEIKRIIAETHKMTSEDEAVIPPITSSDIVSLLAAVLIQAKPLHLATNLYYVESYQQTLNPCDPLCTSLETFQKALSHVLSIDIEEDDEIKPVRLGRGMSKEIELEELAQLTCYMGKMQQRKNSEACENSGTTTTPLECQLQELAGRIERAMDNDESQRHLEDLLINDDEDNYTHIVL